MCRFCCVAARILCFFTLRVAGTRSVVWACEADGPSCGMFVVRTPEQQVRLIRPHMHSTAGILGMRRSDRKGVVPRGLAWFGDAKWRRRCGWRDPAPRPVVFEKVVAGWATFRRPGGRCRCVLAMGNSVAPVVHLVVEQHKDSQCAALTLHSGAECA